MNNIDVLYDNSYYKIVRNGYDYTLYSREYPGGRNWKAVKTSFYKEELYLVIEDDVRKRKELIEESNTEYFDRMGEKVWIP